MRFTEGGLFGSSEAIFRSFQIDLIEKGDLFNAELNILID
jgi:hypothetical protein